MRIYLQLTPNKQIVPYNYQHVLTGAIHKWLGYNREHDEISLYSFSWLKRAIVGNGGLRFPNGTQWFISGYDDAFIRKIIKGIREDPEINYGLRVTEVVLRETPYFAEKEKFIVASPVFIKRFEQGVEKHFTFSDKQANHFLTETFKTKLSEVGIDSSYVSVSFDTEYHQPKTKLINYKGIKNRTSICPILIEGTPEQIAFAWNVGIGNSTGIGFGALN